MITQFRARQLVYPASRVQPDWIVVLLPTAIAIRAFSAPTAVLITGLLVAAAFLRKPDGRFPVQAGPLLLLFASSAIVLTRTAPMGRLLTFLLVGALVLRLVMTVDARRILASLTDGCGLYLVANVVGYAAGVHSPGSANRIGGLALLDGSIRTIFPFSSALNVPPTIAAVYVTASIFLIMESGWLRRLLRLICFIAAIIVLGGAGSRQPMITAVVLPITLICFPFTARWVAQATTILAAISAFILPRIITSIQFAITPLASLTASRANQANQTESIISLSGREYIWEHSIEYWIGWVNNLPDILLGFGVQGQYRSGASLTYSDRFSSVLRNPELATLHNSFLQQLFDGGLVGWLLLVLAVYWASTRLANRRRDWGYWGLSAVGAMAALLIGGMTEASLAPGATQDTFWLLVVLIGVSCQANGSNADHSSGAAHRDSNLPSVSTNQWPLVAKWKSKSMAR